MQSVAEKNLISECVNKFYPIHTIPMGWKPLNKFHLD